MMATMIDNTPVGVVIMEGPSATTESLDSSLSAIPIIQPIEGEGPGIETESTLTHIGGGFHHQDSGLASFTKN